MDTFLSSWRNYHQYDDNVKKIYLDATREQYPDY